MGGGISNSMENLVVFPSPESSYDKNLKNLIWIDENHPIVGPPLHPSIMKTEFPFFPALLIKSAVPTQLTVLYWHGNSCDLGQIYDEMEEISDSLVCNVCALEFPGYGLRSDLTPTSDGINKWSVSAFNFLVWNGIPPGSIFLFGRSIGTGPACTLSYKLIEMDITPAGLILHSPFKSLKELSRDYAGVIGSYFVTDHWDNQDKITKLPHTFPLLIIHGLNDEVIPVYHGKSLLDISISTKKSSSFPPDCPHNEYYVTEQLVEPIKKFLDDINFKLPIERERKISDFSCPDPPKRELSRGSTDLNAIRRHLSRTYSFSMLSKLVDSPITISSRRNFSVLKNLFSTENLEDLPEIVLEAKNNALSDLSKDNQ